MYHQRIPATVLFIDQVEGEVSGDKNEKTLYELINRETWNGSFHKKVIHK